MSTLHARDEISKAHNLTWLLSMTAVDGSDHDSWAIAEVTQLILEALENANKLLFCESLVEGGL